jgi:hypothetical protein
MKGKSVPKRNSEAERQQIIRLTEAPDDDIDLSDSPEIDLSKRVRAEPPGFVRRRPVYLDLELHQRLSEIADRRGVSLEALVNEVLEKELAVAQALR